MIGTETACNLWISNSSRKNLILTEENSDQDHQGDIKGPPVDSWPGLRNASSPGECREKCQKEEEDRHTHHKCKYLWMNRIMKQLLVD